MITPSRKLTLSALALTGLIGALSCSAVVHAEPPTATGTPNQETAAPAEVSPPQPSQPEGTQPPSARMDAQPTPRSVPFVGTGGILLLAGGGLVVALGSLATGITAHLQLRRSHQRLRMQSDTLQTRLSELELQVEQDRIAQLARRTPRAATPMAPRPAAVAAKPVPAAAPAPAPAPPAPQPVVPAPAPVPVSKAGLIAALNSGDRQPLREAATAELNITSDSENAIATGRAVSTELEAVAGGGSYWLIAIDQHHWLFPTDRTLKGFAAAQPSKGLFHYEKQTIAQPQLLEPAQLNSYGDRWIVTSMGRIGTP